MNKFMPSVCPILTLLKGKIMCVLKKKFITLKSGIHVCLYVCEELRYLYILELEMYTSTGFVRPVTLTLRSRSSLRVKDTMGVVRESEKGSQMYGFFSASIT